MAYLLLIVPLLICGMAECAEDLYGKPVQYALNQDIRYPDFTIRFIGTRREVPQMYPRGFLYYDFEVSPKKADKFKVSWSAGTGELGPVGLAADGKDYFLELRANSLAEDSSKRWLKENEMIIWKKETYLEKQRKLVGK